MHCYINQPIHNNQDETSWFSTIVFAMFYSIFGYTCHKLIYNHWNSSDIQLYVKEYTSETFKSINDTHDDKYKQKLLTNLLSINSLERCYILYFIFKRKGDFTTSYLNNNDSDSNTDTNTKSNTINEEKTYNSYELYNKIVDKYNLTLKDFNLDENEVPDIIINIGDNSYELTLAKLHFIQWLYYTGIYDYLMSREDIKFDILNEMNTKKLLSGNLFLRYQLFLSAYEPKEVTDETKYDETKSVEEVKSVEETEEASEEAKEDIVEAKEDIVEDNEQISVEDSDVSEEDSDVSEDISEEQHDFIEDFKSEIYNMRKYIIKIL